MTDKRKLELSKMLLKMGDALEIEGDKKDDIMILHLSSIFSFLAGVVLEDDDIIGVSDLLSMFSARKVLDDLESRGLVPKIGKSNNDFIDDIDSIEIDDN